MNDRLGSKFEARFCPFQANDNEDETRPEGQQVPGVRIRDQQGQSGHVGN